MLSTPTLGSAVVLVGRALAQTTHEVGIVDNLFSPNTLNDVASGDRVRLTFTKGSPYDILSSSFDTPCSGGSWGNDKGGISSDVHDAGEKFVWIVNSTDPSFYFCSIDDFCPNGMILAINPTDSQTQEKAVANAQDGPIQSWLGSEISGGWIESASSSNQSSSNGTTNTDTSNDTTNIQQGSAHSWRPSVTIVTAIVGVMAMFV